jgi:hypothetical protein
MVSCAILQKLVILTATQNLRNKTFNVGDFPFLNQIFFVCFFFEGFDVEDFKNSLKIHDLWAHL